MSIFSDILSKIFPSNHPAVAQNQTAGATTAGAAPGAAGTGAASGNAQPGAQGAASRAAPPVDVEQVLNERAAKRGEKLNWRTSIVDLMKLLDLDSSLTARKELATELHYSGDKNDSAAMNIWLHKQVMTKLAANGGQVPEDLRH